MLYNIIYVLYNLVTPVNSYISYYLASLSLLRDTKFLFFLNSYQLFRCSYVYYNSYTKKNYAIKSVAMGSQLGPTLSNIILCYWDKIWFDIKPYYYKIYLDDTFLLFKKENSVEKSKECLNNKHKKH